MTDNLELKFCTQFLESCLGSCNFSNILKLCSFLNGSLVRDSFFLSSEEG
uniref:Uncharacterized protein n=1 Tax=Rhizophora mucronata TaxID=61149 RepID=A0A2P2R4U8_RHIMU